MQITVCFEAQLRQVAGVSSRSVEVPAGSGLLDAVRQACDDMVPTVAAAVRERIFQSPGLVHSSLLVFVNQQAVPSGRVSAVVVQAGDEVLLCPPIAGG